MSATAPATLVKAFAADADPAFVTYPVPAPAQATPGAASLSLGFPPITMADPASAGGVPPFGQDMNGILRMVTAYCVWLQAGGGFMWDAAFVAANTGYAIGAMLRSASVAGRFFYNTSANNANNPDVTPTGWIPCSIFGLPPGTQDVAPGAGSFTVALTSGAGFLEITPSAMATLTNVTGAVGDQILTISNLAGSVLTIEANAHFRMTGDLGLLQNQSATFRWNSSLSTWIPTNG